MVKKTRLSGYTTGYLNASERIGHCKFHEKTAWATRKLARRAAKNRHPEGGKTPYRCAYLQGWHYGTPIRSRDAYRGTEDGTEDTGWAMDARHDEPGQPGKFEGSERAQGIPDQ